MSDSSRLTPLTPSLPPEDLSQDRLLSVLARDEQGRPVLGRIPIICRLGRGGMGAVYYAIHPRLNLEVAVKVLPFNLVEQDPRLVERFVAEARMAASLTSDHIVRVLDVDHERDTHFLVMEFVAGESAGAYLKRVKSRGRAALDEVEAIEIVTAATKGLAVAHARGIIHRDIKPDNIMIPTGARTRAKLADLGLAKPDGGGASLGTASHVAMGTPGYMAPEQAEDAKTAGPPADVFSMGATLYALLTGRAPFAGSSLAVILRDTAIKEPEPLPPTVGAATRALVARCLAKDPKHRFTNGAELLAALQQIAPEAATPVTVTKPALSRSAPTLVPATAVAPKKRNHALQNAIALLVMSLIVIVWVATRPRAKAALEAARERAKKGDLVGALKTIEHLKTPEADSLRAEWAARPKEAMEAVGKFEEWSAKARKENDPKTAIELWETAREFAPVGQTQEVDRAIETLRKQMAQSEGERERRKRDFDEETRLAMECEKTEDWAKAAEAWARAAHVSGSPTEEANCSLASRLAAERAKRKKLYELAVAEAKAAEATQNWEKAMSAWGDALQAWPDDATAIAAIQACRDRLLARFPPKPKLLTADVALDGVTLRWTLDGAYKFMIGRQKRGDNRVIIANAVEARVYIDQNIEPKTAYTYCVWAVNAENHISQGVVEIAVQTLGIWRINVISPSADTQMAMIEIEKFDKSLGRITVKRLHKVGDAIGTWDGTTKHRVTLAGPKSVEVDFATGCVLKTIESQKVLVEFKKCVPVFDKTGKKSGCDMVAAKKTIATTEVTILDDGGQTVRFFRPSLDAPDELCQDHAVKK